MPSRDEILKDLIDRVTALEARVNDLDRDPWEEEFESSLATDTSPALKDSPHVPAPLAPAAGPHHPDDPTEDTPEVIEARRRIAQANAEDVKPVLHTKEVKVKPTGADSFLVSVPVPTKQQRFMREAIAKRVIANLPGLDHDIATKAYIEGGPIWLHAFDRDHVIGLPGDLRQEFIKDVAMTAPESAHELSSDIMKEVDPDVQAAWAHDNMENVLEEASRRGG